METINKLIITALIIVSTGCSILDKKGVVKEWTISKYKIKLYHGQGIVGPDYYYYRLDKKNVASALFFKSRRTPVSFKDLNSCTVTFNKNTDAKFSFDICTNKPKPKKELLDEKYITSIEVSRIDSVSVKKVVLSDPQRKVFIDSWNQTNKFTPGSPRIKYLISVQQGYIRTFNSDGIYLYEQQEDAKYKFADTTFFRSLFDK